jgi:hypothetical protein
VISSDSDSCFLVGKLPRTASNGKWHLFTDEGSASVCGRDCWERLHERVEPRSFNPETDGSLQDVIGLGEMCRNCAEYVRGQLEDGDLPKPDKSTNKCWTGNSILEDYRRSVEVKTKK